MSSSKKFSYPPVPPPRSEWLDLRPCDMKYIDPKYHPKIEKYVRYGRRALGRQTREQLFYQLEDAEKDSQITPITLCKLYNQCASMLIKRGKYGRAADIYNRLTTVYRKLYGEGQQTLWSTGKEIIMYNKQENINIKIRTAKQLKKQLNEEKERQINEEKEKQKKKEEKKKRKKEEEKEESEEEKGNIES